ncbi:hypothetical protein DY000_02036562 [Brassica cretica]|uniref:Uncharacterized protein n=1 Tax=Brassica cretica TaxID=69181 RepID=A0ABQ7BCG2_BRACR|nr:hypothetical protein DY000_02036562 [Brassica cretica]
MVKKTTKSRAKSGRGEPSNRNHSRRAINADSDYDLDVDDDNMSGKSSSLVLTRVPSAQTAAFHSFSFLLGKLCFIFDTPSVRKLRNPKQLKNKDEDGVSENNEGLPRDLLGSCNDRARHIHASSTGRNHEKEKIKQEIERKEEEIKNLGEKVREDEKEKERNSFCRSHWKVGNSKARRKCCLLNPMTSLQRKGDHRAGLRREETISSENVGGSHKPDICKDYKDTGYCGLDSHDHGCYKVG